MTTQAAQLALAFAERLTTIRVANGYATDIGATVFRGKGRIDVANLPCAVIYEAGDKIGDDNQTPGRPGDGNVNIRMADVILAQRYFFEGHMACDADHPNDAAHAIIGDLKKALFNGDRSFGKLVRRLQYKGRAIGRREDGQAFINASIVIDAEITENLANP